MKVLLFIPRMAALVRAGTKRQTIRATRRNPIVPGDELSLRTWTGKPYRSPQEILRDGEVCKSVEPIRMEANPRFTDGIRDGDLFSVYLGPLIQGLDSYDLDTLAMLDGFKNSIEMYQAFRDMHGFPFEGHLIKW